MKETIKALRKKWDSKVILFAVFLTLFLSCNVKKAFQLYLDIPVTKSLNVSKSTITSQFQCDEEQQYTLVTSPENIQHLLIPVLLFIAILVVSKGITINWYSLSQRIPYPSDIPLYILYKKMKVMSC